MVRPTDHKLRDWFIYVGIGLAFVLFTIVGTSYAPKLTDHISHWFVFSAVTAFVFGYQLHDFWSSRGTFRFWLATIFLFICHFVFWVYWVHPRFGGDPRLLAGGTITVSELLIVSSFMGGILPQKHRPHSS
jgi:hypothetical protein